MENLDWAHSHGWKIYIKFFGFFIQALPMRPSSYPWAFSGEQSLQESDAQSKPDTNRAAAPRDDHSLSSRNRNKPTASPLAYLQRHPSDIKKCLKPQKVNKKSKEEITDVVAGPKYEHTSSNNLSWSDLQWKLLAFIVLGP